MKTWWKFKKLGIFFRILNLDSEQVIIITRENSWIADKNQSTKAFHRFRPTNLRIQGHSLFDHGEIKEFFSQFELAIAVLNEWDDEGKQMERALGNS